MKRRVNSRPGGFSLIELLQALVIFSIVIAVVFSLFIQVRRQLARRERQRTLSDQTGELLDKAGKTIAGAGGWIRGDNAGIYLIGRSGDTIYVRRPAGDSVLIIGRDTLPRKPARLIGFKLTYLSRNLPLGGEDPEPEDPDQDGNGIIEGLEMKDARIVVINARTMLLERRAELSAAVRLPEPVFDAAGRP